MCVCILCCLSKNSLATLVHGDSIIQWPLVLLKCVATLDSVYLLLFSHTSYDTRVICDQFIPDYFLGHLCFVQFSCAYGSEATIHLMALDVSQSAYSGTTYDKLFLRLVCCNTRLNVCTLAFCSVSPWDARKILPSPSLLLRVC